MATHTDRRVTRTRAQLQEALIELIIEKGYEAVTVQDIIDRANVGRSTFYAHFLDKKRLLLSGLAGLKDYLAEQQQVARAGLANITERALSFSLPMFEHAADHHHLYKAMVGRESGVIVQHHLQRLLNELVQAELSACLPPKVATPVPTAVVVHYIVSAYLALLNSWLDQDMPCPVAEIERRFRTLTLPGVAAGLGVGGN